MSGEAGFCASLDKGIEWPVNSQIKLTRLLGPWRETTGWKAEGLDGLKGWRAEGLKGWKAEELEG